MKAISKSLILAVLFITGMANAQEGFWAKKKIAAESAKTTYYYLPELESYYDVKNNRYIYAKDGKWISAKRLPERYKNYTYKTTRRVVLTDKSAPYKNFSTHKAKYYKNKKATAKRTVSVRPGKSGSAPGHTKHKHHKHGHDKK